MPKVECSTPADVPRSRFSLLAAAWLVAAAAAIVVSFFLDPSIAAWVRDHPVPFLTPIARVVSKFLDWPGLMVIGVAGLVFAWVRSWHSVAKILIAMIIASTLAGILANSSRLTTGRTRPRMDDVQQGWYGPWHDGKLSVGISNFNSFPSGHTATALGFAGIMLFTRRHFFLGIVVNLLALGVAWSRVQLGAHHLSDVVTGAALGWLVAAFVWSTQQKRLDRWATKWISLRRAGEEPARGSDAD